MKKYIIPIFMAILFSCGQGKPAHEKTGPPIENDSTDNVENMPLKRNVQPTHFSKIDSSGILIFPLTLFQTEKEVGGFSSGYKRETNYYWNIIFYNTKTATTQFLSEQKMLIENYDLGKTEDDDINNSESARQKIFYKIITDDFDNDKKLTPKDPSYLFMSDREGNHLQQVSPSNYNLLDWHFVKASHKIILYLQKDSDNNKVFDEKDKMEFFEYDLGGSTEARPIFNPDFKNKIKSLYQKSWPRSE